MKQNTLFETSRRLLLVTLVGIALAFTACTGDAPDGNRLPDGRYPMTFTAAVHGLTVTRGAGKDAWSGGEEIAVKIDGTVKKYTAANDGTLSAAAGVTPFYWRTTKDEMIVSAWYPYTGENEKPAVVVKADQSQAVNYKASDLLAAEEVSVSYANPEIVFQHRTAKVVVKLVASEGIDLAGATVKFMNLTGVEGVPAGGKGEVTPSIATSGNGDNTYSALLPPQDMHRQQFICITTRNGNKYYYIPQDRGNADLKAGNAQTYTITVKQTGLSVTWEYGEQFDDTATETTIFKIYQKEFTKPEHVSGYRVTDADGNELPAKDGIYELTGNEMNVSLTASEGYIVKSFSTKITDGFGEQEKGVSDVSHPHTYTWRFHNIQSDLWLSDVQVEMVKMAEFADYQNVAVGDYFYSDGTCSSSNSVAGKTCIGIVFKVGADATDDVNNYPFFFVDNTIHGYVVALKDADSGNKGGWGGRGTEVDGLDNDATDKYDGYYNTHVIQALPNYDDYWAFKQASEYSSTIGIPFYCSGWYLPSIAQLVDIYQQITSLNFSEAGGTAFNTGEYWSSTQRDGNDSYKFDFSNEDNSWWSKDNQHYSRAILTF